MKIKYNAPTTLSFTLASALVLAATGAFGPALAQSWFSTPAPFHAGVAKDYVKLFTHVLGHASVDHFISNFSFILLLGPILEATYGSVAMLLMILATALATGLLNVLVFPGTVLLGASGVVFMMILLSSFTNFTKGEVPLTFILVMAIYLGREVWAAVARADNVSQFAHVIGGMVGSFFGFVRPARRE